MVTLCFVHRVSSPTTLAVPPNGFLLAVEGIDGAGKSTVMKALGAFCEQHGLQCVMSREPTDGPWGKALRASAATGRLSLQEELELFLKDRAEHVTGLIQPALDRGKVVLLDRYYLSTAAYQGARGANPAAIIRKNEKFAPRPNLVLLLDIDPASGLGRVRRRGDVPDEFEHEEALQKARQIFLSIEWPQIVRVDAGRSAEEVARECVATLRGKLLRSK